MLSFELKKMIKSQKFLFLVMFSIFMAMYGFFFAKGPGLILEEYDFYQGAYSTMDNFFGDEPAPKELKDLENEFFSQNSMGLSQQLTYEEELESQYQLNQWKLDTLNQYQEKYPQIMDQENQDNLGNLKWAIHKYQDLQKNQARDVYYHQDIKGDNLFQRIIFSTQSILGIIPILFFVLLFSNLFSREREDQTLNLIYSQPQSRKKIVLAKFLVMVLSLIFYVGVVFLLYFLFAWIQGLPLDGGLDLYRILNQKDYLAAYNGYQLLALSSIAFLSVALFWSSLALFLSTRLNSQQVVSYLLVVIAILYASTPYLPFLRTIYNPIYNLDVVYRLLGDFELLTSSTGMTSFSPLPSYSIHYYLLFLVLSLLILVASLYPKSEVGKQGSKNKKRYFSTLFQFETLKIFNSNSYKVYLLGCVFLIMTNFAVNLDLDQKVKIETFGDSGKYKMDYLMNIDFLNLEIKRWENILAGKDSLTYYKTSKDAVITSNELTQQEKEFVENQILDYQSQIDALQGNLAEIDQLNQSYRDKDGQTFYPAYHPILENQREMEKTPDLYLLTQSKNLTKQMFDQAAKENVTPLTMIYPFYSPFDSYKDLETTRTWVRRKNIYNHSGPIYLFNLFWNQNLAGMLIVLAVLMVISGFTLDTEEGRQIEWLLTSSYSRGRLFYTKILSQFTFACITTLSMLALIFVLGWLSEGLAGYNLPIASYLEKDFELIPLWRYLLRVIGGIMAYLFLLTSLMTSLSVYIKQKLRLLALSISTLLLVGLISQWLPPTIKLFSPTTYLSLDSLADQSIQVFEQVPHVSYEFGIGVILAWGLIFLVLGRIAISLKKEFV